MSRKEAPRIGLLKALVARRVTGREVATALAVTVRQVWRLKRRFESSIEENAERTVRDRPAPRAGVTRWPLRGRAGAGPGPGREGWGRRQGMGGEDRAPDTGVVPGAMRRRRLLGSMPLS
jgi:hypothetical protein